MSMNISNVTFFSKAAAPVLLGQADAFTDSSGFANFSSLIVSASPGDYLLHVSVPQYDQVPLPSGRLHAVQSTSCSEKTVKLEEKTVKIEEKTEALQKRKDNTCVL